MDKFSIFCGCPTTTLSNFFSYNGHYIQKEFQNTREPVNVWTIILRLLHGSSSTYDYGFICHRAATIAIGFLGSECNRNKILIGSLIIELALFSTIRIPKPTQIRPILKRSYAIEYVILAILLIGSSAMLYFIIQCLGL